MAKKPLQRPLAGCHRGCLCSCHLTGAKHVVPYCDASDRIKLNRRLELYYKQVKESAKKRSCNRHVDCDAADRAVKAKGGFAAAHCNDECCEECFGN